MNVYLHIIKAPTLPPPPPLPLSYRTPCLPLKPNVLHLEAKVSPIYVHEFIAWNNKEKENLHSTKTSLPSAALCEIYSYITTSTDLNEEHETRFA